MILAERVGAWAAVAIFRAHSGTRETLDYRGSTCQTRITSVLACSRTGVLTGRERWRRVANPRISCLATCFSPPVVLRLCGSSVCVNCQNGSSNDSLVGGRSWNLHWTYRRKQFQLLPSWVLRPQPSKPSLKSATKSPAPFKWLSFPSRFPDATASARLAQGQAKRQPSCCLQWNASM